jgi:hypothetical protein
MQQAAKRVMFSESCSEVSLLLRHGVNTGTYKSMRIRLGPSTSLIDLRQPEVHLTLNRWNVSFVNHIKYPSVILDKILASR